jgi:hypothetical protein
MYQGGNDMKRSKLLVITGVLGIAGALSSGAVMAATGADFYKGKTLTWIVATGPGGGHDYYGRLMARHIKKPFPASRPWSRIAPAPALSSAPTLFGWQNPMA